MSVAIAARGGGSQGGVTSYTVTFASAPTEGQLLVVVFRRDGGSSITAPAGWAEHAGPFEASFDAYVFAKIAGPSESATHTWNLNAATNVSHRHFVIDGFAGPIDASNLVVSGSYFASTSTPDPPLVSIASLNGSQFAGIAVAIWDSGGASLSSYPSGYINGANHTAHSGVNIASAEFDGDAGTTYTELDPGSFTLSAARKSLAITIATIGGATANNDATLTVNESADTVDIQATQQQTATLTVSESADTVDIAATQSQVANIAASESPDAISIEATQAMTGTVVVGEASDAVAITATAAQAATIDATESSDTVSIEAAQSQVANIAASEQVDSVAIEATQSQVATLTVSEQTDSVLIDGSGSMVATVTVSESADTASLQALQSMTGTVTVSDLADTVNIQAAQSMVAQIAATETADSVLMDASGNVTATIVVSEATDTAQLEATQSAAATLAITEAADSVTITESVSVNSALLDASESSDSIQLLSTNNAGLGPTRCCCIDCQGCCFPYDYLEPPAVVTAGNYAQIIKWVIDAPHCPELDGLEGQFSPETTGPHDPMVFCGFCLCYNNTDLVVTLDGTGQFEVDGNCNPVPCGITICLGLQCARTRPVSSLEDCCNQFRLIVVFIGGYPTGGQLVDTSSQCFEGEGIGGNANFPGCNITQEFPAEIARELLPAFCQCEDNEVDPPVPFEVVFNLSELAFGCPDGDYPSGSPCEGFSRCCVPTTCSLVDATVTLTRL